MKKRIPAIFMAMVLALGVVACSAPPVVSTPSTAASTSSKEESMQETMVSSEAVSSKEQPEAEKTGEVVKLQMLSMPANSSGIFEGWGADIIRERIGVEIELLPSGDQGEQKLQALMASGELPDLVVFKENKQISNAVAGDMLLSFDDHKELVPNVYKNAPKSLQYYADNLSEGQGKAFSVGSDVKTSIETKGELNWGPYLRYDFYKELGSPKIETSDDYLKVLKDMQEKYPTNADGKKRYAFSIWKDWDRSYLGLASNWGNMNGITFPNEGTLVEIDHNNNNKVSSMLAEDSWHLKGLKIFYEANQLGLLDPDSMTQRFDDALQKAADDRVYLSFWGWALGGYNSVENQNNGIGFMPVQADNAKILHQGLAPIGKPWSWSVSKSTKYPEKAFGLVDLMYNGEALMELKNGPKGTIWDIGTDGKPVMLEEGYSYINDPTKELPQGGNMSGTGITSGSVGIFNAYGLNGSELIAEYSNVPLNWAYWDKPAYAPAESKMKQEWQKDYDAVDQIDYLTKKKGITVAPFVAYPLLTDEMEQISARVGEVMKTNAWKMIFAKDEAEYEALKADMIEKAEGMGIQKFVDWYDEEYKKALEFAATYSE